jgi:hypothetical protein
LITLAGVGARVEVGAGVGAGVGVGVGAGVGVEAGAAEARDTVPSHNKAAKTKQVSLFIFFKAIVQTDLIAQIISIIRV